VATFEGVTGRDIPVRFVSSGEPVPGLPEQVVGLVAGMET